MVSYFDISSVEIYSSFKGTSSDVKCSIDQIVSEAWPEDVNGMAEDNTLPSSSLSPLLQSQTPF